MLCARNIGGGGLVAKLCLALATPNGLLLARLLCPWDFPGKNTGVGCHFLLQGIFLTRIGPGMLVFLNKPEKGLVISIEEGKTSRLRDIK